MQPPHVTRPPGAPPRSVGPSARSIGPGGPPRSAGPGSPPRSIGPGIGGDWSFSGLLGAKLAASFTDVRLREADLTGAQCKQPARVAAGGVFIPEWPV